MNYKLCIIMLTLCALCLFGGCTSSVAVGSHILPNGTYRQIVEVDLDLKGLSAVYSSFEIGIVSEVTYEYMDAYLLNLKNLADNFARNNGYVGNHCVYKVTSETINNAVVISGYILYSSTEFYSKFMESLSESSEIEDDDETVVQKGLFYNKIILVDTMNPVADKESINTMYTNIETELQNRGVEFKFGTDDLNLVYDYAIPYKTYQVNRIRSNADREYVQTETSSTSSYQMKHFVWNCDSNGETHVVLYRYEIKSAVWYISALIAVVIFGVVIYLVYLVRSHLKRKTASANGCEISTSSVDYPNKSKNDNKETNKSTTLDLANNNKTDLKDEN